MHTINWGGATCNRDSRWPPRGNSMMTVVAVDFAANSGCVYLLLWYAEVILVMDGSGLISVSEPTTKTDWQWGTGSTRTCQIMQH